MSHPLTGKVMEPKPLYGSAPVSDDPDEDRREALARWMTSPDNRHFARVMANRVWADLMGRGIVDPVDDLRATNPPSNGPLLDALADDFRRHIGEREHERPDQPAAMLTGLGSMSVVVSAVHVRFPVRRRMG